MSSPLSVCFSAVGRDRVIISIENTTSLKELYQAARFSFSATLLSLKHGFPPTILKESTEITLNNAGVRDKDRIIVSIHDDNANNNNNQNQNTATTTATTNKRTSSKRAAAKAATESFGDVIHAQDRLMHPQSNANKKKAPVKRKHPVASTSNGTNGKLAKLPGRRLQDGAAVGGGTWSHSNQKSKSSNTFKNEEDVSVALMNALNKSGGGKVGQVLRGAMKSAIANSYEASRAVCKVAAVQSKQYTISERDGRLTVEYSKGLEGRGMWEETVDNIPRDALEAVITAIHQNDAEREMLKANTLAQVSPRVFWSLAWLFRQDESVNTVEECLQSLLPDLDWSFQTKRKITLSTKAQENLRQEQSKQENADDNLEAAQEAVQAVEDAMEQLSEFDASQRRERAARAAMSRHDTGTNGETVMVETIWRLITPTEEDDEELEECIATNVDSLNEVKRLLSILHSLKIHNWRQLANADDVAISNATNIPRNQVEKWTDHAQAQAVEEMIVEVCDNRVDVVEVLRDEARTGTVKDLANWKNMPDLLYSSAPSLSTMNVQVSDVRTWCQRAQNVMNEYEWVQWYATPVE